MMTVAEAYAFWTRRAAHQALLEPEYLVGLTEALIQVPCAGVGRTCIYFPIQGADVSKAGNCLYHAVWTAAIYSGIHDPFGMRAFEHVFGLRVLVAMKLHQLLEEGRVENPLNENTLTICNLVATPNQYHQYSGLTTIMAMSLFLKRTIVVLSCDGIMQVIPFDASLVDGGVYNPVLVYHCASNRISKCVRFEERNHYIPVKVRNTSDKEALRNIVHMYRMGAVRNIGVQLSKKCRNYFDPTLQQTPNNQIQGFLPLGDWVWN